MALLDVSSVLLDPDFTESIIIRRRQSTNDQHGRPLETETDFHVLAVVTADSPSNLQREEDYGAFMRSISVVLQFRIRGQSEQKINGQTVLFLPDIVVWRGNNFIVDSFDPYPQFGNGFFQASCQSMDRNDNALDQVLNAQANFNQSNNSGNIYLCC